MPADPRSPTLPCGPSASATTPSTGVARVDLRPRLAAIRSFGPLAGGPLLIAFVTSGAIAAAACGPTKPSGDGADAGDAGSTTQDDTDADADSDADADADADSDSDSDSDADADADSDADTDSDADADSDSDETDDPTTTDDDGDPVPCDERTDADTCGAANDEDSGQVCKWFESIRVEVGSASCTVVETRGFCSNVWTGDDGCPDWGICDDWTPTYWRVERGEVWLTHSSSCDVPSGWDGACMYDEDPAGACACACELELFE